MTVHIGNFVRYHAALRPQHVAVVSEAGSLTYAQLERRASGCARALAALGVLPADRVVFALNNGLEWLLLYQGILRAGAVPVPLNPLLAGPELAAIIQDCAPRLVLARPDLLPGLAASGITAQDALAPALTAIEAEPAPLPVASADSVALMLYSSGSTGRPKGIQLTHGNIFWNAQAFAFDLLRLTPEDRGYGVLPFSHVFGHTCLMSSFLYAGATLYLAPRFDAAEALATIACERITIFMGVPTMYWTMADAPLPEAADISAWRACVSGGQALPEDVHRRFESRFNVLISEGYGMTELSPSVTGNRFFGARRKPGSAGQPYLGVRVRILDDQGQDVPAGALGEIVVSGPGVAKGYFNQPELTAQTFRDGWLYSGDIGRLDEDGFLYVVDRKKEMIITGGYNVYPREVEELLYSQPGILEAAAIGVPDERLGERIVAFLVPSQQGAAPAPEAVLTALEGQLARYKLPRAVHVLDALPRNATGKVDRIRLRAIGREIFGQKA